MNETLFDLSEPEPNNDKPSNAASTDLVNLEHVKRIRAAFSSASIQSQTERKEIIQKTVNRQVGSLEDLQIQEVQRVIYAINDIALAKRKTKPDKRTAWDDRDEETWIDKL